MKYQAILSIEAALEAVKQDGYALRYVLTKELFLSIAAQLKIKIED
jgi:hypothetical protein